MNSILENILFNIYLNSLSLFEIIDSDDSDDSDELVDAKDYQSEQFLTEEIIHEWSKVVNRFPGFTLEKRLLWDNLDAQLFMSKVKNAHRRNILELPKWVELMALFFEYRETYSNHKYEVNTLNPNIPFHEITEAIALFLSRYFKDKIDEKANLDANSKSNIVDSTIDHLKQKITYLSSQVLYKLYNEFRPGHYEILSSISNGEELKLQSKYYSDFIKKHLQDNLVSIFDAYPVLAKLIFNFSLNLFDSILEFVDNYLNDYDEIAHIFQIDQKSDIIFKLSFNLSDLHNRNRTAIKVEFASGVILIYKPKDLGVEIVYHAFLDQLNNLKKGYYFPYPETISKNGYGWVEWINQKETECNFQNKYFEHCGALLAVSYFLRFTDLHYENLIAMGSCPVVIDAETICYPDQERIAEDILYEYYWAKNHKLNSSVLRVGILPVWQVNAENKIAFDISALGGIGDQLGPRKVPVWHHLNSDGMYLTFEHVNLNREKNEVFCRGKLLKPTSFITSIMNGFNNMYDILLLNKTLLFRENGPLNMLKGEKIRYVFRATNTYNTIMRNLLLPEYLTRGYKRSVQIELLSGAFSNTEISKSNYKIYREEITCLERLDIPYFLINADKCDLLFNNNSVKDYIGVDPIQQLQDHIQNLNLEDKEWQKEVIFGSLISKIEDKTTTQRKENSYRINDIDISQVNLIAKAESIADSILEKGLLSKTANSINWMSISNTEEVNKYQLSVLSDGLYQGNIGIAIYFGALFSVTSKNKYKEAAKLCLSELCAFLKSNKNLHGRYVKHLGLGLGNGVSGIIYGLIKVYEFTREELYLELAQSLSLAISKDQIDQDSSIDMLGGSSGVIIALLSLFKYTNENYLLELANYCSNHILNSKIEYSDNMICWKTLDSMPLCGFSHGSSGIAFALTKIHKFGIQKETLKFAKEAFNYESRIFDDNLNSWPDLRSNIKKSANLSWCHGVTGIGISRLEFLKNSYDEELLNDLKVAFSNIVTRDISLNDTLCCGNMGQIDFLLQLRNFNKYKFDVSNLIGDRIQNILQKEKETGKFMFHNDQRDYLFRPSLFQGMSGIGYTILRIAFPTLPSIIAFD